MALWRTVDTTANNLIASRLTQSKLLYTNLTNAESTSTNGVYYFNKENGWFTISSSDADSYSWMWKRAPSYFDVVAYTGTGSPNVHAPTLSHSLGVPPEMVWVKKRSTTSNWAVVSQVGTGGVQAYLDLNNGNVGTLATTGPSNVWSDYFTATQVIGNGGGGAYDSAFPVTHLNATGTTYIAYLFATLAGVSKVGSYTGNGGTTVSGIGQDIDCGFSSGVRFVLIKPTNAADNWFFYDSARGIVAGNDATLILNTTTGQSTSSDEIDPLSSGFTILNRNNQLNRTGRDYIFYAIA
jgi:hypothetical protein